MGSGASSTFAGRGPDEPDGRRRRSLRTRARIVDAAGGLFVEQGYLATTIEAIADAAGVAAQTVYYLFGTKRAVLEAVLDARIAGDAEPVPVMERPWTESIEAAPDAATAIGMLVDGAIAIIGRATAIYEVVRRAAADPEVGELLAANRAARRADQRRLVEVLAGAGHLRSDLEVGTAADVVYAVLNEEVFRFLVVDCGWSADRLRRWTTALLIAELAGASAQAAR